MIFLICAVLLNIYLQHVSTLNLSLTAQSFLGRTTSLYQSDALSEDIQTAVTIHRFTQ